jgi:biotin carboxyl carrier protein
VSVARIALAALLIPANAKVFPGTRVAAPTETTAWIVTAPLGGTVVSVPVHTGDAVKKGQVLIRLHAGELENHADRAMAGFEKFPLDTLDRGAALLERISPRTWLEIFSKDPARLRAEQEYVAALAAYEQAPSPATEHRLKEASQERLQSEANMVHRDLFQKMARQHHESAPDVAWLRRKLEGEEMRSPVDGKIAIFDLHPGDQVAPNGRILLIEAFP